MLSELSFHEARVLRAHCDHAITVAILSVLGVYVLNALLFVGKVLTHVKRVDVDSAASSPMPQRHSPAEAPVEAGAVRG